MGSVQRRHVRRYRRVSVRGYQEVQEEESSIWWRMEEGGRGHCESMAFLENCTYTLPETTRQFSSTNSANHHNIRNFMTG